MMFCSQLCCVSLFVLFCATTEVLCSRRGHVQQVGVRHHHDGHQGHDGDAHQGHDGDAHRGDDHNGHHGQVRDDCSVDAWRCHSNPPPQGLIVVYESAQNATGYRGRYDVEAFVKQLAQLSIPTLCTYFNETTNCELALYQNKSAECKQRPLYKSTVNQSAFINYMCTTQLSNLQAAQRCLTYDLVIDVACCGIKDFFSSNCSAQDAISCAKQKISAACGATVVQALDDIDARAGQLFFNGRNSTDPRNPITNFCPRPYSHHGPGGYPHLKSFFKFF